MIKIIYLRGLLYFGSDLLVRMLQRHTKLNDFSLVSRSQGWLPAQKPREKSNVGPALEDP